MKVKGSPKLGNSKSQLTILAEMQLLGNQILAGAG